MNENEEILEYIYQTSNIGMQSTKDLIISLKGKDNKIKSFYQKSKKIMKNILKKQKNY